MLAKFKHPPWEPEEGRPDADIRIRVGITEGPEVSPDMPEAMKKAKARRNFYVTQSDIQRHGMHPGPLKCRRWKRNCSEIPERIAPR